MKGYCIYLLFRYYVHYIRLAVSTITDHINAIRIQLICRPQYSREVWISRRNHRIRRLLYLARRQIEQNGTDRIVICIGSITGKIVFRPITIDSRHCSSSDALWALELFNRTSQLGEMSKNKMVYVIIKNLTNFKHFGHLTSVWKKTHKRTIFHAKYWSFRIIVKSKVPSIGKIH